MQKEKKMNKLCYHFNFLRSKSTSSWPCHHGLLWFSATADAAKTPKPHSLVQYLIDSCGLSPESASKACVHLHTTRSPSDPDSILRFLKQAGFGDAHVAKLVSKFPRFLYTNLDRTLKPKLALLQDLGLSGPEIADLVSESPSSLWLSDLRTRLQFWQSLLGTNENLLKACRRDIYLLSTSIAGRVMPNLSLLRERGVSDCQIANIVVGTPRLLTRRPEMFRALLERAEELGFSSASSSGFRRALHCVACNSKEAFDAKFELLKTLGWSEADGMSVIKKHPTLFNFTEENLRQKMGFFVEEVGFEISSLLTNPVMFNLSLKRRLRPRHSVMRVLKGGEVPAVKASDFFMSDKSFLERYVIPNKEKVPGLYEAYFAACAEIMIRPIANMTLFRCFGFIGTTYLPQFQHTVI
ncbi:putative mitochondrial transcription termination factor family protein [Iris pallida]|uniref:Mitochondrial transcription termination factor family protein n=1 Tax=Iris pallida TaxID=29817 RepID=A0AAX6ECJ4_IRIPA|nr:putative mitochondrial transcription termination factor family protein [Iris pallida]